MGECRVAKIVYTGSNTALTNHARQMGRDQDLGNLLLTLTSDVRENETLVLGFTIQNPNVTQVACLPFPPTWLSALPWILLLGNG